MGRVYEAEQDSPRRTVALKVVKPGVATGEGLQRFQRESQLLGRLQHPGIAAIYQAGTADAGRNFNINAQGDVTPTGNGAQMSRTGAGNLPN